MTTSTHHVVQEVYAERRRQDELWGEQNHPDGTGTGSEADIDSLAGMRDHMELLERIGNVTWRDILVEEVKEAIAKQDPVRLRAELIQVAAVAVNWVEAIDRRVS